MTRKNPTTQDEFTTRTSRENSLDTRILDLNRPVLIPKIYIPREGSHSLKGVYLVRDVNVDLLWYHWPIDGVLLWEQDYEPVAIVYKDSAMQYVITRRHWRYQVYPSNELAQPLEILFDGSSHPPFPKLLEDTIFQKKIDSLESRQYAPRLVSKDFIPMKFHLGNGHACIPVNRVDYDPIAYANMIYQDYCEES